MISTVVTTSTVSIATTLTGSLAMIGVVLLVAILVQKEFTNSGEKPINKRINQVLNIALPPLLLSFIALMLVKIMGVIE
jgi:hypothetical protein